MSGSGSAPARERSWEPAQPCIFISSHPGQLRAEREGRSNYSAVPVPGTGVPCQECFSGSLQLPEMDGNH